MKFFQKFKKSDQISDTFATLIRAAQEDPEFKEKLVSILKMDSKNRQSALNSMINKMKLKQESEDFISAIKMFLQDEVAEKALDLLSK